MSRITPTRGALVALLLLVGATALVGANPFRHFAERMSVGVGMSSTQINCLPWSWYWLNSRVPEHLSRGDMVQIRSKGLEPIVDDGTRLIKIVAGLPGDTYQTTPEGLYLNGEWYDEIRAPDAIATEEVQIVQPGTFFALGVTDGSFDSRYFGPIDQEELIGSASPVFAPNWDTDYDSHYGKEVVHRLSMLIDRAGRRIEPGRGVAEAGGGH